MKKTISTSILLAFLLVAFAHAEGAGKKNPTGKSRKVFLEVGISQPNVNDCYSGTSVPLQENIENWVNLFPNPNQGHFNLELKGLIEGEGLVVMVFDLSGKKVHQINEQSHGERFSKELNMTFLTKGVYFIHVQTDRKKSVKQLIIL